MDANGQNVNTNIYVEAGAILDFEVESRSNGWCDQVISRRCAERHPVHQCRAFLVRHSGTGYDRTGRTVGM